jgi:hypothetical protein
VRTRKAVRLLRPAVAPVGLVVFIGGVATLFTTDNTAGSLFLMTLGLVLLLVAFFGSRIELESFEILGTKLKVREVVRGRLELAELAASRQEGDRDARVRQAGVLQELLVLYDLYQYIRRTQPASQQRTAQLDSVAARMKAAGQQAEFDFATVSTWFHQGDDSLRVLALNLMRAREECRDFLAILKTVGEPRSNFEQFYGLILAEEIVREGCDRLECQLLADAIGRARRTRRFRRDKPLVFVSDRITAALESKGITSNA